MTQLAALDLSTLMLLHRENVFASGELLLPSLNLLLSGKCVCPQDAIDHLGKLRIVLVEINRAFVTLDLGGNIITVCLGLGGDSQLGDLFGRLVSVGLFSSAADVEDEGMASQSIMKATVEAVSGTSTIEALQTHIEAVRVILQNSNVITHGFKGF